MLTSSTVLFAIAALGGIVLGVRRERPPMAISIIHGLVAAVALVLLILAVLQGSTGSLIITALILFIIAALGGFVLFSFHLRGRSLPKALIAIHGLIAAAAEVLLIVALV